ncbi:MULTISPECIES: hypothetical protein [Corynebacterium]|uniref:hypothetical protein n=1 Tax=Corynebacterium TaxID=1716 RepID=UPI0011C73B1F|nr:MULTISPECIES: hypothetical protein [Corynebacterium]MBC6798103.1 hypothetical protein [Corynebacterium sp. LK31]MDK7145159.1 hypothetical protein [Corynebacterium amycolatum]TXS81772.1 hypothetical protein CHU70_10925 [Corynebacterium sp. LK10]
MAKFVALFIGTLLAGAALIFFGNSYMSASVNEADLTGLTAENGLIAFLLIASGIVAIIVSVMYFPGKILKERRN